MQTQTGAEPVDVEAVIEEFVRGIVEAIPHVLLGILFLAIAYVLIRVVLAVVRRVFDEIYPADQQLVVDLWVAIVGVFLWFGAALALFNIVGLGDVAASLGTASGFVGLGVAYALKEMIADTVAGVYLLRDPDFNEGDVVESASVTGEIVAIDLRKTRLRTEDGDLVVVANRDVEKRWRQESVGSVSAQSEHAVGD
ncbi:mechanosensitive ion channel domain-containing protein [Halorubellus sp. PRR65]|uniref:mechanosensitive ion channel family protein n=1 Tax=Halorubellus sp. PRR65 TaxID=3098148 RepID=UPI002B259F42|nr:mechanosensitive ion channel domain-containing protein [Halorubellus sp. PRR65]